MKATPLPTGSYCCLECTKLHRPLRDSNGPIIGALKPIPCSGCIAKLRAVLREQHELPRVPQFCCASCGARRTRYGALFSSRFGLQLPPCFQCSCEAIVPVSMAGMSGEDFRSTQEKRLNERGAYAFYPATATRLLAELRRRRPVGKRSRPVIQHGNLSRLSKAERLAHMVAVLDLGGALGKRIRARNEARRKSPVLVQGVAA